MKNNSTLFIGIMIFASNVSFGQPGSLDANFDADGKVVTDISEGHDFGNSIAIQPDGKIIVAGSSSSNSNILVIRYYPDGSMDNSFDLDGIVITEITGDDFGSSVVIQTDGKIVVAGGAKNNICLVRYNTNGSLDAGFGSGGIVINDVEFASGSSVALQPDGKILVAGTVRTLTENNFIILRYNTDGSPDNTFSFDGMVTTDFNGKDDNASSIKVQADEKIVVAGSSADDSNSDDSDFAAARYNTDGTLDNSFGTNGMVTTDFLEGRDAATSIVLQPDGKILLNGYHGGNDSFDFATLRYNVDGTLDSTFNGDGKLITSFGSGNGFGNSIALQPDGKILLVGLASDGGPANFALARINSEGMLDLSFGESGKVFTDLGGRESAGEEIVVQSDGNFLVAGSTGDVSSTYDIAVAKYLSGLNIGVIDFSKQDYNLLIYPNPLQDDAVIEYTLADDDIINIDLYDISGRLIQSIVYSEERVKGSHKELLNIDTSVPSGSYILTISNGQGSSSVRVVK